MMIEIRRTTPRIRVFDLLIFLAFAGCSLCDAKATSCRPPREAPQGIQDAKANADLVFSGYVVSEYMETSWNLLKPTDTRSQRTEAETTVPPWLEWSLAGYVSNDYGVSFVQSLMVSVRFKVFHVWKGDLGAEVEVSAEPTHFQVGESYLVYATQDEHGRIGAPVCGGTKRLKSGMVDLTVLGRPSADKVQDRAAELTPKSKR